MESLFSARLHYPAPRGERSIRDSVPSSPQAEAQQVNGQLMGNPASFPILAIVNLIGFWQSLEDHLGREVDASDLPVLVNGDDIVFRADDSLFRRWKQTIEQLGLTLSVGKSYVHRSILSLNSELFRMTGSGTSESDFRKIEFLNLGLLRKGFAQKTLPAHACAVAPSLTEVLRGAHDHSRALRRFLHFWRSEVESCTRGGLLNLFLPTAVGGVGAEAPPGLSFETTLKQRSLAIAMKKSMEESPHEHASLTCALIRRGAGSASIKREKRPQAAAWTHCRHESRIPESIFSPLSGEVRVDSIFDPWEDPWSIRFRIPSGSWIKKHVTRKVGELRRISEDPLDPDLLKPFFLRKLDPSESRSAGEGPIRDDQQ